MEIRALRETDDRSSFRSGDEYLDRFFWKYAGQNQFRHHIGVTYVAVDEEKIVGFATVAPGHVEPEAVTAAARKKFPRYPLPILRLARLAVDATRRNRGVGEALLKTVFEIALKMAQQVGCVGVVVDANPEAAGYYAQFGFFPLEVVRGRLELRPRPVSMFLSVAEIKKALE